MGSEQNPLEVNQAKIRFLLALWDLGADKEEVGKGKVTDRILSQGKKVADFQDIFTDLEAKGAIAISHKGYKLISPQGLQVLGEILKSPDFKFDGTIVGSWIANALVRWIAETPQVSGLEVSEVKVVGDEVETSSN